MTFNQVMVTMNFVIYIYVVLDNNYNKITSFFFALKDCQII